MLFCFLSLSFSVLYKFQYKQSVSDRGDNMRQLMFFFFKACKLENKILRLIF